MIYMTGQNTATGQAARIVVISDGHLSQLRAGRPLRTPDGEVIVCWTPDEPWLAERIEATGGDTEKIAELIVESMKRQPSPEDRPRFEAKVVDFTENRSGD